MKHWRQHIILVCVFTLALPVFCWLRWTPDAWLNARLSAHGLSHAVQVSGIEKGIFSLRLTALHLQLASGHTLALEAVKLSPAWPQLIRGIPAVRLVGSARNAALKTTVRFQQDALVLRDMHVHMDASMIRDVAPEAAVANAAGDIVVSGDLKLRLPDGVPVAGKLTCRWQHARTAFTGGAAIGDYALQLAAADAGNWSWRLQGGSALNLRGHGQLHSPSPRPEQWRIEGAIDFKARPGIMPLAGNATTGRLMLSGSLARPSFRLTAPS